MAQLGLQKLVVDLPNGRVLDPMDFPIQAGDCWGVLGPNGAGKTTLLHTLSGLRRPTDGEILLDQHDLASLSPAEIAQQLTLMQQTPVNQFPGRVRDVVRLGRYPHRSRWQSLTQQDEQIVTDVLVKVDLLAHQQRDATTLSGGEARRLALALALAQTPQVLLLDEPVNHLDPGWQMRALRLIQDYARSGHAVAFSLHDINYAVRFCTHLLLIYPDGSVCWGRVDALESVAAFEKLYDQKLKHSRIDGQSVFIPLD